MIDVKLIPGRPGRPDWWLLTLTAGGRKAVAVVRAGDDQAAARAWLRKAMGS